MAALFRTVAGFIVVKRLKTLSKFAGCLVAGMAWLSLVRLGVTPALLASLTPTKVQQLSRFERATGLCDVPG
ncbi:MAG: hypothetical protein L0387_19135 [Acidobacteria bacterium]|nr:hypothetical protein [Acidobacteriota bacterium]MCI0623739.1 hypothetical protein [Acidobacteriota bacterium]